MNLLDTVVQLLKFFAMHSRHGGAMRKGDHIKSWEMPAQKSITLSAKAVIPFLTSLLLHTNIVVLSSKILLSGLSFLF